MGYLALHLESEFSAPPLPSLGSPASPYHNLFLSAHLCSWGEGDSDLSVQWEQIPP